MEHDAHDDPVEFHTAHGVRLRRTSRTPGRWNWLFLPGGPGIGSESLAELVAAVDVPGTSWLVDLPGDGSNVSAPGAPTDPYSLWPYVVLEAAGAVEHPVAVGHSTGGEYLLSVPELENQLAGLVLVSTAPDSSWMPTFESMCAANPLAEVTAAMERYEADPTDANLAALAVASAPWNFAPDGLAAGRDLLARMPYNGAAVEWSAANFDRQYVASWFPRLLPTLIVSGAEDRIVDQSLWKNASCASANVRSATIEHAGHFCWIENPDAVHEAFSSFAATLDLTVIDIADRPQATDGSS